MVKQEVVAKDKAEEALLFCHRNGHSRIIDIDFGYVYCCRCRQQIGDVLGGSFRVSDEYATGHDDADCLKNWLNLTKDDKYLVPRKYFYKKPTNSNTGDK